MDDTGAPAVRTLPRVTTLPESWYHPGGLARTSRGFAHRMGLSQVSRWSLERAAGGAGEAPVVRPPIDYWPWGNTQATRAIEAEQPVIHRALPRMLARRGATHRPGAFAVTLKPEIIDPAVVDGPSATAPAAARGNDSMSAFRRMLEKTGRLSPSATPGGDAPAGAGAVGTSQPSTWPPTSPASAETDDAPSEHVADGSDRRRRGALPGAQVPDLPTSAGRPPVVARRRGALPIRERSSAGLLGSASLPLHDDGQGTRSTVTAGRDDGAAASPRASVPRPSVPASAPQTVSRPVYGGSDHPAPTIVSGAPLTATLDRPEPDRRAFMPGVARHTGPTSVEALAVSPPAVATAASPDGPRPSDGAATAIRRTVLDSERRARAAAALATATSSSAPAASPDAAASTTNVSRTTERTTTQPTATQSATSQPTTAQPATSQPATTSPTTASTPKGPAVKPAVVLAPSGGTQPSNHTPVRATSTRPSSNPPAATAPAGAVLDVRREHMVNRSTPSGQPPPIPSTSPSTSNGQASNGHAPAASRASASPSADSAAEAFTSVLRSAPAIAPRPLPDALRPLAAAIIGRAAVSMRTDHVARRALAAAGKRAATTGSVIHLDRTPDARTDRAVLAHELTHVAHPSPLPRFFADDRPSSEERRADEIAKLVQRSPMSIAASATTAATTSPHGAPSRHEHAATIRRSPLAPVAAAAAPTVAPTAAPTTVTAADLVQRLAQSTTPAMTTPSAPPTTAQRQPARRRLSVAPAAVIRRSPAPGQSSAPTRTGSSMHSSDATATTADDPVNARSTDAIIRREVTSRPVIGSHRGTPPSQQATTTNGVAMPTNRTPQTAPVAPDDAFTANIADLRSASGTVDFVDWIVEQVEDRLLSELQRRGGRFRGDF